MTKICPPSTHPRVIDYGCGIGNVALYLAAAGYEVTAADVPGRTLDFVRHRAHRHGIQLRILEITNDTPDLPHEGFDIVVSFDVLEHVPNPDNILFCLVRSLRSGGVAAINVEFSTNDNLPHHLMINWMKFGRTRNWWIYVHSAGLDGAGIEMLYRKINRYQSLLRIIKYRFWRLTGIYIMRWPR